MTAKRPAKKKPPAKAGAKSAQIELLKDQVDIPDGPILSLDDDRFSSLYERVLPRVHKWVQQTSSEEVAMSLAMAVLVGRLLDREMMFLCETLALDRAALLHQRKNARKKGPLHEKVWAAWQRWQSEPSLYPSLKEFLLSMEMEFPGAHGGTIKNWMRDWKQKRS